MNKPGSIPAAGKIQPHHLDRLAVVYVRQSTPKQVLDNRESTDRQYQLAARATALGWRPDRVLVIDDDLGLSGRTAADRAGFLRLLAEVGLNHVGLILGSETSRLALFVQGPVPVARARGRLRGPDRRLRRAVRSGPARGSDAPGPERHDVRSGASRHAESARPGET